MSENIEKSVGSTIVVADDDIDIRELLVHQLGKAGHTVLIADNGTQALATIQEAVPRVVLLDVSMPGLSGLDVLQAMKFDCVLSVIPVILLTGKSDAEEVARGHSLGAADYVIKPFSPKNLLETIQKYV